jgi:hypothetical protein
MTVFGDFHDQWNHPFTVIKHETRPENFSFLHKRTLFFGLNLVGGKRHDVTLVRIAGSEMNSSTDILRSYVTNSKYLMPFLVCIVGRAID